MTDRPRVTMSPDELAVELFTTSQVVAGRGEAERLLKQIKDRHAHQLAEQIRATASAEDGPATKWNWWDAATIPASCADLIDPEPQR